MAKYGVGRHAKVKIITDIAKANDFNMGTIIYMIAVANDKALTKLVKEFEKKFAQVK
jgi:hypothetical protein